MAYRPLSKNKTKQKPKKQFTQRFPENLSPLSSDSVLASVWPAPHSSVNPAPPTGGLHSCLGKASYMVFLISDRVTEDGQKPERTSVM